MTVFNQITARRFVGYLWICLLVFVLFLSARNTYRLALQTEEYAHSCDPFGYLEMAKEIRESAPRLPAFKIESEQTRLLIDFLQSKQLPPQLWNNLVGPHAYHYFPKAGHVGVQYPPGTPIALALFPEGQAVYRLNLAVIAILVAAGVVALLGAAIRGAWVTAGLVILAIHVAFEMLTRLGSLSFSINVVMVPLLLATFLSLAALWLNKNGNTRLAWATAFGVGLCLGFAVLVRAPALFFLPAFLVLLWPNTNWRRSLTGLPAAMCLAVVLGGFIPLFVHQQLTAGAWYVSTYSPSVQPNLPTLEIVRHNFKYYFGSGYQTEDNWSLVYLLLGFVGWVLYNYASRRSAFSTRLGIGWRRLAVAVCLVWALPTAFFLGQQLIGLHYMMAQNFAALTLAAVGALAIETTTQKQHDGGPRGKRTALAYLAIILVVMPGVVCLSRAWKTSLIATTLSAGPVKHARVFLPPDLADERAWVWADLLTGTLWYYTQKPAFRVRFSNPETRAMVYRFVYDRGEPQYIVRDSDFVDEAMSEITRLGGTCELRGKVDGQPYFLIRWPEGGPTLREGFEAVAAGNGL